MSEPLPSKSELECAWRDLKDIHITYLQMHGVKLPNSETL